jgi:penicillin-binding protein 1A
MIQGWVVVLKNRDGRILAETGGRQVFKGRSASYSDYNRVTEALRQPGSAMKAIVYLAAFQHGGFTLETLVPDEPISVPDGGARPLKWISNYDGRLKVCSRSVRCSPSPETPWPMWITEQIGIDSVLRTSRSLGVRTPLERYPTTALGASEMNLLELANAVPHDGLGHRRRAVRDPGNRARFGRDSRRRPTRTIADLY